MLGGIGGFHHLWNIPRPCHYLQVPRASSLGGRQRLARGGTQPAKYMAEVGKANTGLEQGGCGCPDLGPDVLGGVSVSHVVRVEDMGDDTVY